MLGFAEIIVIIAILAFMFLLFRCGSRPAIMMVLGGVSLLFVVGLVLALSVWHVRSDRTAGPEAVIWQRDGTAFRSDRWEPRGPRPARWSPTAPYSASSGESAAVVDTEVDPLIASGATADSGDAPAGDVAEASDNGPRPAWVDQPGGKVAGGAYVVTTSVGPFKTLMEAEEFLAIEIRDAVHQHINSFIGDPSAASRVDLPALYIMEEIFTDAWQEKIEHESFGSMMNLHARLRFDDRVHAEIKSRDREAVVAGRLVGAGVGSGLLVLLLTTVYGYLKLDTATRGYYTGRLRVATAAMILAIVAAGGLLAQSVLRS